MNSSPLQRAISRGLEPGANLGDELRELGDYTIRTAADAEAIRDALRRLPSGEATGEHFISSPLHALTALFQDLESSEVPAFEVLREEGLAELIRILDARIDDEEAADDLLFVLKILAMYGTREGADAIVAAARRPLAPEGYMWHVVFGVFSEGHPQREYVFAELSDPLPPGFIAIGLLDASNQAALEGSDSPHPFDSPAGRERLQRWLIDPDPDHASYAHSATAAIPFVDEAARERLLELAMAHVDDDVRIEAAWAAGKLGHEAGFDALAEACLDVNRSRVAQQYLAELDREDLIPAAARKASFRARAEFAGWLAHPNELGRPPDELELVDQRMLRWPPEREPRPFWLIRYRVRDQTGLEADDVDQGLVGSITWCFFFYEMDQRPPDDVFAIHCYWEMEHGDLIVENEVTDAGEYASLLGQWPGEPLTDARVTRVAELSPKLGVPSRLVGLAAAERDGKPGWVVLDGPRSEWYPADEQPGDEPSDGVILMIHVGRQLLGFEEPPNRKRYLAPPTSRPPAEYVAAYERLLDAIPAAETARQEELLASRSLLARHFGEYVDALVEVEGGDRTDVVIRVYERILRLAEGVDDSIRGEVCDTFSVLGENFDAYVEALVSRGRTDDVPGVIAFFRPHWDHNLGYGKLGSAAFAAGDRATAEPLFVQLRDGLEAYHRFEEMSSLAEIWHDRGDVEQARELLLDCLRGTANEFETSEYNSDRERFADEFAHHRATYLRLFPDGEAELTKQGIPPALGPP